MSISRKDHSGLVTAGSTASWKGVFRTAICLLAGAASACAQGGQTTQNISQNAKEAASQPIAAGEAAAVLSAGDLLNVDVFNTPELSTKVRINQDGTIAMPVVGNIQVAGLTPAQANAAIEAKLRDQGIMYSPSVSVLVTAFAAQGIDVLGEVKVPGIYPFLMPHSLYDVLSAAGGVTAEEGSTITVTHHDDPTHPVFIHVESSNFSEAQRLTMVNPGDIVDVSRADTIYVLGDVNHAGQYAVSYGQPLTALNALALAQGSMKNARLSKASIVRKTPAGVQTIPVDLQLVEKNKAADPVLQAGDVLVVPHNGAKAFLDIAIPGATAALIGAVAYSLLR